MLAERGPGVAGPWRCLHPQLVTPEPQVQEAQWPPQKPGRTVWNIRAARCLPTESARFNDHNLAARQSSPASIGPSAL
jgi:hypothetical protein